MASEICPSLSLHRRALQLEKSRTSTPTLRGSVGTLPIGAAMGVVVMVMIFVHQVPLAMVLMVAIGACAGFFVVPMNALLQHRGHNLMGAGRSIAVQNFNEQACILGLGAFYTGLTRFGLSAYGAIAIFGVVVAATMWLIRRWYQRNAVRHREEVERLLELAKSDQI